MIIGIDANKATIKNRTGVENFVYQLVLNLLKIDRKNHYALFTGTELPKEISDHNNLVTHQSVGKRPWISFFLPLLLLQNKPDIYLQPLDGVPFFAPKKSIAVVHDLAYKYFKDAYTNGELKRQNRVLENVVKKAKRIICVSESTKKDLLDFYPGAVDKVKVIYLGYDPNRFHEIANPKDVLKLNAPYILYSGRLEERKNTTRLVQAFYQLKKQKNIPHKLVLAGSPGHNYHEIYHEIQSEPKLMNDIIMPGHISHELLPDLIAKADIFAYPSLYEGFGLSLLEAMACGATIVTAKSSSLPEVAGEAAVYIDPLDSSDIAKGIDYLISHPETKQHYQKLAIERASSFSWEKTAREFLKELESL